MRTEDQIKRKLNELAQQKNRLEARSDLDDANDALLAQIACLDHQILLLEWVLNAPLGSYHSD
jgi:hypothetical protein